VLEELVRLSDSLSASELIRLGAPPWQAAHGLIWLAEQRLFCRVGKKLRAEDVAAAVGHSSPLHSWIHLHDLRLRRPATWRRLILADTEEMERLVDERLVEGR
jgi:hypothetical protein